jgi:hypothetical protein
MSNSLFVHSEKERFLYVLSFMSGIWKCETQRTMAANSA